MPLAFSTRCLADTASAFRDEFGHFDSLADELYSDLERLSDELLQKADEVELAHEQLENRERELTERERELTEQRQEKSRLIELLEAQQTRLDSALTEIQSLR